MNADVEIQTGIARQHARRAASGTDGKTSEHRRALESEARGYEVDRRGHDRPGSPQPRRGGLHRRRRKGEIRSRHMGLRSETHVEVRGDLDLGAKLITGPYRTLRKLSDQDPVKPEKKGSGKGKEGKEAKETGGEPKAD